MQKKKSIIPFSFWAVKKNIIVTDELTKVFQDFDDEFGQLHPDIDDSPDCLDEKANRIKAIELFGIPCSCGKNCKKNFLLMKFWMHAKI